MRYALAVFDPRGPQTAPEAVHQASYAAAREDADAVRQAPPVVLRDHEHAYSRSFEVDVEQPVRALGRERLVGHVRVRKLRQRSPKTRDHLTARHPERDPGDAATDGDDPTVDALRGRSRVSRARAERHERGCDREAVSGSPPRGPLGAVHARNARGASAARDPQVATADRLRLRSGDSVVARNMDAGGDPAPRADGPHSARLTERVRFAPLWESR